MNEIAQRIAIAKACGWSQPTEGYWRDGKGYDWQVMHGWQTYKDGTDILPDYCHDLNDMHDAWKQVICNSQRQKTWRYILQDICFRDEKELGFRSVSNATAKQRAETFLKTLDLWIDDA